MPSKNFVKVVLSEWSDILSEWSNYSSDGLVVWSVCLLSCRLGFDSESGQTNDFKIAIHSFPARRSALKGQCGEQAGKFTCCAVGKGT